MALNRIVTTTGYNGTSRGPSLRIKQGGQATVNVVNKTDAL
jgi:FtsP/CotA-like multicopper oxidase with cupredoxin domain